MPTTIGQTDCFQRATETGFTAFYRGEEREYQDTDVASLGVQKERESGSSTTTETLHIRVRDGSAMPVFSIAAEYTQEDGNLLAPFRDRLTEVLLRNALETIQGGEEFDAGLWTIGLDGLQDKHSGKRIPLDAIAAADWQDGHFCVRGEGFDELRFAADAENATLLPWIMSYLLPEQVAPEDPGDAATGHCLAEFRDMSSAVQLALGTIGGLSLILAVMLIKFAADGGQVFYVAAGAVAAIGGGLAAWVYFRFGQPVVLRQLDDAMIVIRGNNEHVIPWNHLTGFAARWVDVHRNHVYSHTQVRFDFTTDLPDVSTISYDATANHDTPKYEQLEAFQAHVSAVIAESMQQELESQRRVAWTAKLAILPDGVEFTKKASAVPTPIDFSRITRWEIHQGLLKIAVDGSKKPTITDDTGQMNFFPGLALFGRLAQQHKAQMPPAEPSHV